MPASSLRTRSNRSSALTCPSWRRNTCTIRSRLLERLPPALRSVERSGSSRVIWESTDPANWRVPSPIHQVRQLANPECQSTENDEPQPQVEVAFGFLIVNP